MASVADFLCYCQVARIGYASLLVQPTPHSIALEREIDARVYRLYGLTPDEIHHVEESAPSSGRRVEPAPDSPPFA